MASSIVTAGQNLIGTSTNSLQELRQGEMDKAKTQEDKDAIAAKFDMLEFQAKNDAINLLIGTLSAMLKSNKEVADEIKRNI